MAYYKKFIIISLLLFIILFNFTYCFADEGWEEVTTTRIENIVASENSNFFISQSGISVVYFPVEKGYIYKISVNSSMGGSRIVVGSSDLPAVNVTYDLLFTNLHLEGDTYTFIPDDYNYGFISISPSASVPYVIVERQKIANMNGAIGNLVDNVGPNALWGIFGKTTSYILIVVSVALGLFLLVCVIRGISKTKSKF